MTIREVLFATDFSPASDIAGRVARDLTLQMDARLRVIHVVSQGGDPAERAVALTDAAKTLGAGVAVDTAHLSGRAAPEIVAHARDKHVDMIVMGTHGRTGMSRLLLGSVAEPMVRLAPCPVLTVPAGFTQSPDAAAGTGAAAWPSHHCIVCSTGADELICAGCRARIRGEALERKLDAERMGRRGTSV